MKKILFPLFTLLLLIAGCGNAQTQEKTEDKAKIDIYTTVYPLQFFTEQIGGEYVNVKSIYPPGADEHTYEPSQKDMMSLADADLFFYIGLGLESFAEKAQSILKNEHVDMIAVGESLDLQPNHQSEEDEHDADHDEDDEGEHDGHNHGDIDPHVWIDPIHAKQLAKQILDALISEFPEQQETFEANYAQLEVQFNELNLQFKDAAENAKRNKIIVAHAAYGYWEQRYGIEQIAISGISSVEEPSQKKLKTIIDVVVEQNIPYILFEQNINSRLADVVRKEAGAEMLKVHNLGVLTDKDIQNKENYFTLMKRNAEVLAEALN